MYTHIFLGTTSSACIMFQFLRGFSRLTIDTGQPIGVLYLRENHPPTRRFLSSVAYHYFVQGVASWPFSRALWHIHCHCSCSVHVLAVGETLWFSFCNSFFQISDLLVRFVIRYILMIKYSKWYFWYDSFQLQTER